MRDSILQVSGKLNRRMHGPPVPVAVQGDGSIVTADDDAGRRRSIYLIVRRSQHLTMFDLFDTPMMEVNCVERAESIVPMQALAMLHSPFAEQAAAALADRVLACGAQDDDGRIEYLHRSLFTRLPSAGERQTLRELLAAVANDALAAKGASSTDADRTAAQRAGWLQIALVLLNSNEFLYVH